MTPVSRASPGCVLKWLTFSHNTAFLSPRQDRKASPLQRGGTLQGEAAAGKDASDKFKAMAAGESAASLQPQVVDGKFTEPRWKEGRWVLESFRDSKGNMDWDAVITAEMTRRRMLEGNPIPSGVWMIAEHVPGGGLSTQDCSPSDPLWWVMQARHLHSQPCFTPLHQTQSTKTP